MKKYVVAIILLLLQCHNAEPANNINVSSDELTEFISMAWGNAGISRFTYCSTEEYQYATYNHFNKHRNHPLMEFIREVAKEYAISPADVYASSSMLCIDNGEIRLRPGIENSDLDKTSKRWEAAVHAKYVELLNDYYIKSDFKTFFNNNAYLYEKATYQTDSLLTADNPIDLNKFNSFFAGNMTALDIHLSINNGSYCYFVDTDTPRIVLGIGLEKDGSLVYQHGLTDYILQELIHEHIATQIGELMPYMEPIFSRSSQITSTTSLEAFTDDYFTLLYTLLFNRVNVATDNVEHNLVLYEDRGCLFMGQIFDTLNQHISTSSQPSIKTLKAITKTTLQSITDNIENHYNHWLGIHPIMIKSDVDMSHPTTIECRIEFNMPLSPCVGYEISSKRPIPDRIAPLTWSIKDRILSIYIEKRIARKYKIQSIILNSHSVIGKNERMLLKDVVINIP